MFISTALFVTATKWKQPKWLSSDEWLNKLSHPYHRILLRNEKKQTIDTYNDLDRFSRHCVELKKPIAEGEILYYSIYIKHLHNDKIIEIKNRLVVAVKG